MPRNPWTLGEVTVSRTRNAPTVNSISIRAGIFTVGDIVEATYDNIEGERGVIASIRVDDSQGLYEAMIDWDNDIDWDCWIHLGDLIVIKRKSIKKKSLYLQNILKERKKVKKR